MKGVKNIILTAGALILGWAAVIVLTVISGIALCVGFVIGSIAFCVAFIYLLLIGKQD
jgi:hypothetical protein